MDDTTGDNDDLNPEGEWIDEMPTPTLGRPAEYNWAGIAATLMKRPGKWRLVLRNVPRVHAWYIRVGRKKAFQPPEHWLTRTVGPRHQRGDLYMAYIGVPGAKAKALKAMGTDVPRTSRTAAES